MSTLTEMRTMGEYFAYTEDYCPIYYLTKGGLVLCAYCASCNKEVCGEPSSIHYVEDIKLNISNHNKKCMICGARIESNDELKEAREMYDLTNGDKDSENITP